MPEVPEQVYRYAAKARFRAAYPDDAEHDACVTDDSARIIARVPGFRAAVDHAYRAGREQAAADLLARANEIEPGVLTGPRGTRRRTLLAAARIAAGPITPAQAAQALAQAIRDGSIVVCTLDDAGRAIEPHGTAAPAQDTQERRTGSGEGHPVGAPHTNAPRPAHAAMIDGYMSPHCTTGMDSCDDQACVCTCHNREADHGHSH